MDCSNIITGEKLQDLANIFLGNDDDFNFNPYISNKKEKHLNFNNINDNFQNPRVLFCYSHNLELLCTKLQFFMNDFVLISHNSDVNIDNNKNVIQILSYPKLIKWFAQNLLIEHEKLHFLPIGMANSQWPHGNLDYFKNNININIPKIHNVYMNFYINNNFNKRMDCYNKLINKIPFLEATDHYNNLDRLSKFEFCICPEGNGIDTNRFWEALYLKTVPIVIENDFIKLLCKNTNIPMIVLKDWDDLNLSIFKYENFNFDESLSKHASFNYYKNKILEI